MVCCAAWGCSNRSEKGVHMYGFPKDMDRRKEWLAKIKRSNLTVTNKDFNNKKICEAHFEADQFVKTSKGKTKLRKDAVPTIFMHRPVVRKRRAPTPRCPPSPAMIGSGAADHSYCIKDDTVSKTEERKDEESERRESDTEGREDIRSFVTSQLRMSSDQLGELGKGAGKGGGGGGSIREAGGAMGKKQAAEEEMYFKRKEQEQLAALKQHHQEEIDHHKKEIERLQREIDRHKGKIRKLKHDD